MARQTHGGFRKNKKVLIKLRSGEKFVDHYVDTQGHYMVFKGAGKILRENLSSVTIYREPPHKQSFQWVQK